VSIDLDITFGHNLDSDRIANLPTLLDRYFVPHLKNIQLRLDRGWAWDLVKQRSSGMKWQKSNDYFYERNLLGIEKDDWQWCYDEKDSESFQEWFQREKLYGYIPLNGYVGMILFVGERSICLCPDVKWYHFLLDSLLQEDLRNFIAYLLDFFHSDCRSVIYSAGGCGIAGSIADEYITQGWSIDRIISHLNDIQPPVKSIKNMIITGDDEIESFNYDSYYVENV
jgi:hypothetical protein